MHAKNRELKEQFQRIQTILDQFELHFRVLIEVVSERGRQTLEAILLNDDYASIRMLYDTKIKIPTVSPVILEDTLRYIVKNLFLQLHLVLTQLNNPKLAINP